MPTPTYDLIASNVLSSSASSVTFSSIPATYRDLVLVLNGNWASINSSSYLAFRANGDTGANYSSVLMYGDGSSPFSAASSGDNEGYITWTSIGYGNPAARFNALLQFQDYSATDKHKSILSRVNDPANNIHAAASRWASTSAVNSITIRSGQSFASGSTFYLYGIVS